jgi:hypothetical protein
MAAAPDYWDDQILTIHDERLEKALNVSYFGMLEVKMNSHPHIICTISKMVFLP